MKLVPKKPSSIKKRIKCAGTNLVVKRFYSLFLSNDFKQRKY